MSIIANTRVTSAISRDTRLFEKEDVNIYEAIVIMGKRSRQISLKVRDELNSKLSEFESTIDSHDEIYENREQIEISRYYERLPKPFILGMEEFLDGKVMYKNPNEEPEV